MLDAVTRTTPYLCNDDCTRIQMAAGQGRQVIALENPSIPYIRTGYEEQYLKYTSFLYKAKDNGVVAYRDESLLIVKYDDPRLGGEVINLGWEVRNYDGFDKRLLSNLSINDTVRKDQILARHNTISEDEFLRLGCNLTTTFISHPYGFKDACVVSESCSKKMVIRYVNEEILEFEDAIPVLWYNGNISYPQGTEVKKAQEIFYTKNRNPQNAQHIVSNGSAIRAVATGKLYYKIIVDEVIKTKNEEDYYEELYKNEVAKEQNIAALIDYTFPQNPLKADAYKRYYCPQMSTRRSGNSVTLIYWIVEEVPIIKGCKLSNRHGNKGVCSIVLPDDEMPTRISDGVHADIIISPLSVTSRMNCGQLFENHTNAAMKKIFYQAKELKTLEERKELIYKFMGYMQEPSLNDIFYKNFNQSMWDNMVKEDGFQLIERPFNSCTFDNLYKGCLFAGMNEDLKEDVVMNGKQYRATFGYNYFYRLEHEPFKKLWARSTGVYSSTGQPAKGFRAHRYGEMECWATLAYQSSNVLQELMGPKSDNITEAGRMLSYLHDGQEAIYAPHDKSAGAIRVLQTYLKAAGYNLSDDSLNIDNMPEEDDEDVSTPGGMVSLMESK